MQAHETIWRIMVHVSTCRPLVSPVVALRKTVEPDAADEIDEVEKGAAFTKHDGMRPGDGEDSAHARNGLMTKKVEE